MASTAISLKVSPGEHLCVVHNGDAERDQILGAYLRDGLAAGSRCLFGVHDASSAAVLRRLGSDDLAPAVSTQRLQFRTEKDPVITPEDFHFSKLIEMWAAFTSSAMDDGYESVRIGAEARWWDPQMPDNDTFIEYESELNRFVPGTPQTILCMYDIRKADGAFIMNAIRVHPKVVIYGEIFENPYYLLPDEYQQRSS
jgi:hypothetical protein